MDSFARMDLFFAVTTAAVIAVAAFACFVGWRLARLLATLRELSEEAVDEAKALRADIGEVRHAVRREGFHLRQVLGLARSVGTRLLGRPRRKSH